MLSLSGRSIGVVGVAFGLAVLAGCGGERAPQQDAQAGAGSTAHEMTIVGLDFAFQAPDTVSAGLTTVTFINRGPDYHHATFVRLDQGKTMADLNQAMATPGVLPAWAAMLGGPNTPLAGDTSNATLVLTPGNYAIVCFIPASDQVPHFVKGMIRPLTVLPDPDAATAIPAADFEVSLTDYDFTFSAPLTPGRHRILVRNDAVQPHEIVMVRLNPGKTMADLFAWMEQHDSPLPGAPVGGTTALSTGMSNLLEVDLAPGDYVLLCFLPDAQDGQPHIAHGMAKQITVG